MSRGRAVRIALLVAAGLGVAITCTSAADDAVDSVSKLFLRPSRVLVPLRAPAGTTLVPTTIETNDGVALHGTLYDRIDSDCVVLVVCGISGNHTWYSPYAETIVRAGFDALLFDVRGFGESEGSASAAHLVGDARAAFAHLIDELGYEPRRIAVLGISLGSVIALAIARDAKPAAAIVEDVFLPAEMFGYLKKKLQGNLVGRLAGAWVETVLLPAVDPMANARAYDGPLLLISGTADPISKPKATVQIAAARGARARVWFAPDAGHAPEVLLGFDAEYAAQLGSFLRGALRSNPSPSVRASLAAGTKTAAKVSVVATARMSAQVTVTDGQRFAFLQRRFEAGATAVELRVDFAPTHAFAWPLHHAVVRGDGSCAPIVSAFAASTQRYTEFATHLDRAVKNQTRARTAPTLAAPAVWAELEPLVPDPFSIHAAVRPRFARKLAPIALTLLSTSSVGAHAAAMRVAAFLPADPTAWIGYGDHGFEGGYKDASSAELCRSLAVRLRENGHLDAASDIEHRAAAMKP